MGDVGFRETVPQAGESIGEVQTGVGRLGSDKRQTIAP
ncbi:hypothetical protein BSU04_04235 [Caballeronia sordidicola]|uniref:Uncharacterized protein n=1 Tax=Caballeronia sordidicola TaxID=196367 RepID=A0A226X953_CABSO|nr:hypothetical protein BSU04_04235 [Caballeronia sordidicola]